MFKRPGNPQLEEFAKSYTDRTCSLGAIDLVIREDGTKGCVWCGDPLKSKHHATRYCKDGLCPDSFMAWAYPQQEYGLNYLLIRQNFCCNICGYDWKPIIENVVGPRYRNFGIEYYKTKPNPMLMKRLKRHCEKKFKPEVDHIVPIYKGGTSIGLDNHQAICYTCHKAKTSKDLSGKRK